ncbi:S-protein homolog 1-like [Cucumis sativus]|uniref:S-protein homolog n=1 Tax=Cucumis sativus TaxID=3659 RepID=A0A0A0K6N5_CUCSA|nr:S-protein homolog 1-like [Cucumis sativus]
MSNIHHSSKYKIIYSLLLVLSQTLTLPSLCLETKDNVFPAFIRWHVTVINRLNASKGMLVHCRSQDDDLGLQTLPPTANITWSFEANFFHSTLFWCRLQKGGGGGHGSVRAAFKVFWHDVRLFDKCGWKNCIWMAKDDGIYIRNFAKEIDQLSYTWEG